MIKAVSPIQFRGWAACRRDGEGPLGLIFIGATVDQPGEVVQLAFSSPAPVDFPDALEDARVEPLAAQRYRIVSGAREWVIQGAMHLHREVGKAFCMALPPRRAPWRKRLFWWLALRLAASSMVQQIFFRKSGSAAP
jgi:hypothetical protein